MMKKNGIFLVWGFWQLVCLSAAGQVDVTFHRASLPVLSGEENNHVGYLQAIRQAGSKVRIYVPFEHVTSMRTSGSFTSRMLIS